MKQSFVADKEIGLLDFLAASVTGVGRDRLKIQLKRGEVKVNGKKTTKNEALKTNDVVEIFLPQKLSAPAPTIVYRDENVVIADKPAYTESEFAFSSILSKELGVNVYPAHRLDTNTTGIMVFALNDGALNSLLKAFKSKQVRKTYVARVFGCPQSDEGVITSYAVKDSATGYVKVSNVKTNGSKQMITRYKVAERGERSLLYLEPITGRTHQLRAQLAFIGCPIVGDGKYGDNALNEAQGSKIQKLRAIKIEFLQLTEPLKYLSGKIFGVKTGEYI